MKRKECRNEDNEMKKVRILVKNINNSYPTTSHSVLVNVFLSEKIDFHFFLFIKIQFNKLSPLLNVLYTHLFGKLEKQDVDRPGYKN